MNLIKWNPMRSMITPRNDWDLFLDEFFGDGWAAGDSRRSWVPAIDIREDDDTYTVTADLPGMTKKDIKVVVKDNVMTLSGERKSEIKENTDRVRRLERYSGEFSRCFRLPDTVLGDKISASFKNGVLTVTLPKAEEVKPKEIEVKIA